MLKQQIQLEQQDLPWNTSLVPSSKNLSLNMVEKPSETGSKLDCITSKRINPAYREKNLRVSSSVYVLNQRGFPLMPCSPTKAKNLLKGGKTKVVKRFPFTIQLITATGESKQIITLGVDPGFKNVGLSAISNKKELFSAEATLRMDIKELLTERRMYRRSRRNRLRYRPARFDNRKGFDLAPSILHKLDSHIRLVKKIQSFLPISSIVLEVANFDIQKIKNPDIEGAEYSEGEKLGFWNTREYILHRDNHTCRHCLKKDLILNVHHITQRKDGGTDRPDNLITLCEKCHSDYHKGKFKLEVKVRNFKPETFMSSVRWRMFNIFNGILPTRVTFGWKTKLDRIKYGIDKSHSNDAFVIANGCSQIRSISNFITQKRRNNRCLQLNRKGFKPSIKREKSKVNPLDLFWVNGKSYACKGMFNSGKYICYGQTKLKEYFKFSLIERVFKFGGLVWTI